MMLTTLAILSAQILYTNEPDLGITPIPAALNEWKSSKLYFRDKPTEADYQVTGGDFFKAEYGKGLAPFSFTNGYKSVLFGKTDKAGDGAIRLGRGWGKDGGRKFAVRFDIVQNVATTDWTFVLHNGRWPSRRKVAVRAKPGVRQTVYSPVGDVRNLLGVSGLDFACTTTNASVTVHGLELVSYTVPVAWRGTFDVGFEPWKAGFTFWRRNHFTIRVNGTLVSEGLNIDGQSMIRKDVTPYLHAGKNTFDIVTDLQDGYVSPGELVFEAFAVSRTGEVALMSSAADWRVKFKSGAWTQPKPDCNAGWDHDMPRGHAKVPTGMNPTHAGPLQVRHLGPQYPVFDADAAEIAYEVSLPPEIGAVEVIGVVSNTLTGAVVKELKREVEGRRGKLKCEVEVEERNLATCAPAALTSGETPLPRERALAGQRNRNIHSSTSTLNFNSTDHHSSTSTLNFNSSSTSTPNFDSTNHHSSTSTIIFSFSPLKTGPYKIHWSLVKGGTVVDRCRSEFLVAGPIAQTECTFDEYDKVLEKRMRLIQEVDCTKDETDETRFAEHASRNGPVDRPGWKSRVVTEKGLSFRATGNKDGDWFAYKLDVNDLAMPHILEVDYPDTREQVLCVSVSEEYPHHFCNNWPWGGNRCPNASGAVRTGWMTPLTNTKKTLRVLFFAGSKNITVSFENGFGAGVCGFRLYKVPEGLPALKLPETERLYGNHCERPLMGQWGAGMCAKGAIVYGPYYENAYLAAFVGIRNRIAQLRYLGQNLAIEGVYMYKQYFPTTSGESNCVSEDFDFAYILSKMYRHNKIRAFAGFEYLAAPSIMAGGGYDVGDREMLASKTPCTPSHHVHWKGYQTCGFGGSGLNYLAPHVWNSITNLVGEIYRRYEPTGGFEGLFVINNGWWLPGYSSARDVFTERDVGYDDLSVELFQKETGIDLGVPYAPDRFERRYRLLNGTYEKEWYGWRAMKMRRSFEAIQAICSTGAHKWQVYAAPGVEHKRETNPFKRTMSTVAERDGYYPKLFRESGFPYEIYGTDTDSKVRLVPRVKYERNPDLSYWGMQTSAGARDIYAKSDAVYFEPVGLDERWVGSSALKKWWWNAAVSSVYDVKPSGTAAFFDMVDVCAGFAPKLMVHTWLDVNIPTAHGRESRRFATGFAAMPRGAYRPFPAVKGVQAAICADAVVLVNDTPYELKGELAARRGGILPATVTDTFAGEQWGSFAYTLPPYGITVMRAEGIADKLSGAFRFADREAVATALRHAAALAENEIMLAQLSAGVRTRFRAAWAAKDEYGLVAVLRDFEIRRTAERFFRCVVDRPSKPAAALRLQADYRGAPRSYRFGEWGGVAPCDPKARDTNRCMTVSMLVKTDGRAGDIMFGDPIRFDVRTFAGREHYDGTGLNVALTCFRTKPGQKGWYSIGMAPYDGAAKDVWHHVCFTVDPENCGAVWVDGALVDAREMTDHHGLSFKPAAMGIGIGRPCPKGQDAAGLHTAWMARRDGVMDWRDIQREAAEWLEAAKAYK